MTNRILAKLNVGHLPAFDYGSIESRDVLERVQAATTKVKALQQAAILEIGRELLAVKEALPHGLFVEWIESEFGWAGRTAERYMSVAERLGSKFDTVSHLPPTALYKLAARSTPSEVREAVLDGLKPGQVVTAQSIREAVDAEKLHAARKLRREKREEIEEAQAQRRARILAELTRDRQEQDGRRQAATEAAERVRDVLGDRIAELADLLETVDRGMFGDALVRLALQTRYSLPAATHDAEAVVEVSHG